MAARSLLVIGGSGAMGRHVIKHVLALPEKSWHVRIFTRDPTSLECRALQELGAGRVDAVKGDVEDDRSIRDALKGAHSVFCNTNYWSSFQQLWARRDQVDGSDPWPIYRRAEDAEVHQGQLILELAREAGVERFLYSSLDAMAKPSGGLFHAPHFDAKARVQAFIDERRRDTKWYAQNTTVLVTVPYMENFLSSRMFRGGGDKAPVYFEQNRSAPRLLLRVPLGGAQWPMVTLDDIGWFAAHIIGQAEKWSGQTLEIASDALTMQDIATVFRKVTGIEAIYEPYTLNEYRSMKLPESDAIANMFGFIAQFGINRDLARLRQMNRDLASFESWLIASGWRGEHKTVQKELTAAATH